MKLLQAAFEYFQDPTTKLYMLKARAYDATLGRFLSVDPDPSNDDPKQDATLNANLYLYTNNNPITRTDPDGTGFKDWVKKKWNDVGNAVNKFTEPILASKHGLAKATALAVVAAVAAPVVAYYGVRYAPRAVATRWASRYWTSSPKYGLSRYGNMMRHFNKLPKRYRTTPWRMTRQALKQTRNANYLRSAPVVGKGTRRAVHTVYKAGRWVTIKSGGKLVSRYYRY